MLYLYYSLNSPCFKSIIETISAILTKHNIENQIIHEIILNEDLWLICWPNIPILPKKCIIYNFDPVVKNVTNQIEALLKNNPDSKVKILDYCYSNKNYLYFKSLNLDYKIIPYGISQYHMKNKSNDKDIDILFYGGINARRNDILKKLKNKYNIHIRINDLYDENEKAELISRSKIILSIASNDALSCTTNDLARLSFVVSNKGFILAEKIGDKMIENISGINYFHIDELEKYIDYFLNNLTERQKNIQLVYNNFKKFINFDNDILYFIKNELNN